MKFEIYRQIPGSEWLTIVIPGLWTQPNLLTLWLDEHVDEKSSLHIFNHYPTTDAETAAVDENGLIYLADVICRHIEHNPHARYHIVGHSMGGLLAQMVKAQMMKLEMYVTLISPAPPQGVMLRGLGLYLRMLRAIITGKMLKKSFAPSKDDFKATMFNKVTAVSLEYYEIPEERMRLIWDIVFARIKIRKLGYTNQVRIVGGEKDQMISEGTSMSLAKYHRCDVLIHKGGHLPFIEKDADQIGKMVFNMTTWGFE